MLVNDRVGLESIQRLRLFEQSKSLNAKAQRGCGACIRIGAAVFGDEDSMAFIILFLEVWLAKLVTCSVLPPRA